MNFEKLFLQRIDGYLGGIIASTSYANKKIDDLATLLVQAAAILGGFLGAGYIERPTDELLFSLIFVFLSIGFGGYQLYSDHLFFNKDRKFQTEKYQIWMSAYIAESTDLEDVRSCAADEEKVNSEQPQSSCLLGLFFQGAALAVGVTSLIALR